MHVFHNKDLAPFLNNIMKNICAFMSVRAWAYSYDCAGMYVYMCMFALCLVFLSLQYVSPSVVTVLHYSHEKIEIQAELKTNWQSRLITISW